MTVQPGVHLPSPLPFPPRLAHKTFTSDRDLLIKIKRDSMSFADEAVNIDEHCGKRRVMGADGYSIYFQPVMGDEETEARLQSLLHSDLLCYCKCMPAGLKLVTCGHQWTLGFGHELPYMVFLKHMHPAARSPPHIAIAD